MRALSWLFLAVLAASVPVAAASAAEGVRWAPDLETAMQQAAETNRLVVLHFWAPWCGPCMRLDREVFNRADVGASLVADYVPVKLNYDDHKAIARRYGVEVLPTDVIITPDGQLVKKVQSPPTAAAYTQRLSQVALAARPRPQGTLAVAAISGGAASAPAASTVDQASQEIPTVPTEGRYADYLRQTAAAPVQPRYASQVPAAWPPSGTDENLLLQPPVNGGNDSAAMPAAEPPMPPPFQAPIASDVGLPAQPPVEAPASQPPAPSSGSQGQLPRIIAPPGNPPLALDGYCPIHLAEKLQWVPGDRQWGAIHRGRTYLFASPACQQQFLADPDRYSPLLGGHDPVVSLDEGRYVPGSREHGVFFDGRIVLFSSESSLNKFYQNPDRYSASLAPNRQ